MTVFRVDVVLLVIDASAANLSKQVLIVYREGVESKLPAIPNCSLQFEIYHRVARLCPRSPRVQLIGQTTASSSKCSWVCLETRGAISVRFLLCFPFQQPYINRKCCKKRRCSRDGWNLVNSFSMCHIAHPLV